MPSQRPLVGSRAERANGTRVRRAADRCADRSGAGSACSPVSLSTTTTAGLRGEMLCCPRRESPRAPAESPGRRAVRYVIHRAAAGRCQLSALEQPGLDQCIEAPRQNVRRDVEALLKLVEARQPEEGVAQDQNAPPLADPVRDCGRSGIACSRSSCVAWVVSDVHCIMQVTKYLRHYHDAIL